MTQTRWLAVPALVLVAAGLLVPLAMLILPVVADGDAGPFARTGFLSALSGSVRLGLISAALSTALGLGVAVALTRVAARIRTAALAASAMPLALSAVVIAFGFLLMFGRSGVVPGLVHDLFGVGRSSGFLFTDAGLVLVYIYFLVPRAVFVLHPVLAALRTDLYRVARSLGARPWRAVVDAIVPQVAPAFLIAFGQCFAVAVGSYGAALALLGSAADLLPIRLVASFAEGRSDQEAPAYALIIILLCLVGGGIAELVGRGLRR